MADQGCSLGELLTELSRETTMARAQEDVWA